MKKYFFLILLFFSACASDKEVVHPECDAITNMAFETPIQSVPTKIVYQNGNCIDITSNYGPENDKVFFLQIKDGDVYKPSTESKDERYVISQSNVMITYKKIAGKPVIIFEASMFGAIYAFIEGEERPALSEITYPKGYVPKNNEIIGQIEGNKLIFKVTEDVPNIGDYGLYTLKKDSQIEIDFIQ